MPSKGKKQREALHENYVRNKKTYLARSKARKDISKKFVEGFRKDSRCVDCGNADYRVLDFDHQPEYKKSLDVCIMAASGYSISTIITEINKCHVVCANCHRIRTWERKQKSSSSSVAERSSEKGNV